MFFIDIILDFFAHVAQLVEHIHGKDVVVSSILTVGSREKNQMVEN